MMMTSAAIGTAAISAIERGAFLTKEDPASKVRPGLNFE